MPLPFFLHSMETISSSPGQKVNIPNSGNFGKPKAFPAFCCKLNQWQEFIQKSFSNPVITKIRYRLPHLTVVEYL